MFQERVLSGMRPTGALHLGHYHGVLKNWVSLQSEYPCLFFVADWHALTTHYDDPSIIESSTHEMVIDWLAAGIDPSQATIFVQSQVTEHAELFLLLAMSTPLGWLERVPTYKEQIEKLFKHYEFGFGDENYEFKYEIDKKLKFFNVLADKINLNPTEEKLFFFSKSGNTDALEYRSSQPLNTPYTTKSPNATKKINLRKLSTATADIMPSLFSDASTYLVP